MKIAFYVSGHGFGHATRMVALAAVLQERGAFVYFNSNRPEFLYRILDSSLTIIRKVDCDFGIVQNENLIPDVEATSKKLLEFWQNRNETVKKEVDFCRQEKIDFIIADLPPLAFEIAQKAKIRAVGVSNFDWHFIYRHLLPCTPSILSVLNEIKSLYATAAFAVQLPFSSQESMACFPLRYQLGLLAKKGKKRRKQFCREWGIKENIKIVFLALGAKNVALTPFMKIANLPEVAFFSLYPQLGGFTLSPATDFSSIIPNCDVIIGKTGYSTQAEALQAGKFFIYYSYENYPEYELLRAGLQTYAGGKQVDEHTDLLPLIAKLPTPYFCSPLKNKNEIIADFILKKILPSRDLYGIFDVGTNNLQFFLIEKTSKKTWLSINKVTALGKNMKNGFITKAAQKRLLKYLKRYLRFCRKLHAAPLILATSCSREAKNIGGVIAKLPSYACYNIISPHTEAELNGLASLAAFPHLNSFVSFDIGGGSTEFTYVENRKIVAKISLPLGLRRLQGCRDEIEKKIECLLTNIKKVEVPVIGIGGTVTSIGALYLNLEYYDYERIQGQNIPTGFSLSLYEKLAALPAETLVKCLPFEPQRADIMLLGLLAVNRIIKKLGAENFYVSAAGIAQGVLYSPDFNKYLAREDAQ